MLTDESLEYIKTDIKGKALVWIIDGQCLYDLPLNIEYAEIFLNTDNVIDVSNNYPEHYGITVQLRKGEEVLEEFKTSEYFGSILLSDPTVLDLSSFPGGNTVVSPNATFDGERFIPSTPKS